MIKPPITPTQGPHAAHGARCRSVRLALGRTHRRTADLTGMLKAGEL